MILILLVSTLHFSIYKMECLMTGNSQVSLTDFDDCNSKPNENCSVNEVCCCFHQMNFDFDYVSEFSNKTVQYITAVPTYIVEPLTIENTVKEDFNFYTKLPPPSGNELLKLVQIFRL